METKKKKSTLLNSLSVKASAISSLYQDFDMKLSEKKTMKVENFHNNYIFFFKFSIIFKVFPFFSFSLNLDSFPKHQKKKIQ